MPKIIPFFENLPDNTHCLQSCLKSVLAYYFPDRTFTAEEIDKQTIQTGGWSWLPPAVIWLHDLGLNVELYSLFDYSRFAEFGKEYMKDTKKIYLFWLAGTYVNTSDKTKFFDENFNFHAGNATLQQQIKDGVTEEAIRKTWEPGIAKFKVVRKKYLLYKDF